MKKCELCKVPARTYCESDQASLCWDCDAKVHGANFLVARHYRTLLCHVCQSQTPWKASGAKLGAAISVCESCDGGAGNIEEERESEGGNDDLYENDGDLGADDDDFYDDSGDIYEDDADDEEEGDNQVVPWSTTPPPAASSSSDEEESVTAFSLKRKRENASDLRNPQVCEQGDLDRSSFQRENAAASKAQADDGEATSIDYSLRPWKDRRIGPDESVEVYDGAASSSATVEALTRIRGRDSLG